jgi:tungstate transport system permease protein
VELIWEGLVDAVDLIGRRDPALLQIVALSLGVSCLATILAAAIGLPLGTALYFGRVPANRGIGLVVNTGMGLPPVVVGLGVTLVLWRTGPLGALGLLYSPAAMVLAQLLVALPLVAGFCRVALSLLDPDLLRAMRADGATDVRAGYELILAAWPQVLVAIAAGFGRAIAEVGASLMVGGNIVGQTRILTTAIALETSKGDFALAIALGLVLLVVAFVVNASLSLLAERPALRATA